MSIKERLSNINQEDFFNSANLHTHSNYSDGNANFIDLINSAREKGLKNFSISDHNTVKGYLNCDYQKYEFLIPAVEFDVIEDFILVHILGYGINPKSDAMKSVCTKTKFGANHIIPRLFEARSAKRTIDAIHMAGGVAVLAHPCCMWAINIDHFVKKLKNMGLDGIEVYYPYRKLRGIVKFHSENKIEALAKKYDLIMTGGTDCHTNLEEDCI